MYVVSCETAIRAAAPTGGSSDAGHEDEGADHRGTQDECTAEHEPVLEAKARPHALKPGVPLAHEIGAVREGAQAQSQHLGTHDHQQDAADQRVDAPRAPEEV